jgi:hypothetical protein
MGSIRATDPECVTQMPPAAAASLLKSSIPDTGIDAAIWFVDGSIRTTEPLSVEAQTPEYPVTIAVTPLGSWIDAVGTG